MLDIEPDPRQALPVAEVARLLGLHPDTVRSAIAHGDLEGFRIGRRTLVARRAIEALLNGRER